MRALIGILVIGLWGCGMDQGEFQDNRTPHDNYGAPDTASTGDATPTTTTADTTTTTTSNTPAPTDNTQQPETKTPPPPATPQAPAVSFAKDVQPLIMRSCLGGCHTTMNPQANIVLDSMAAVQRNFTASLASIERGSMPSNSFNRPKFSATEIETLKKWRDAKFPQ